MKRENHETRWEGRVERVFAKAVRPMRQRVLRPHQSADELVYPGDDDAQSRHFAALQDKEIIGIASVFRAPHESIWTHAHVWRLRGMATAPEVRGQGVGRVLLEMCCTEVAARGGEVLWCNARTSARGFYTRMGFKVYGGEFTLPGIGPHVVMYWKVPET